MESKRLAPLLLNILKTINKLSKESEFGVVRTLEIARTMNKELNLIYTKLNLLKKQGFVENKMYGHWKLTEKGRKYIDQFGEE